MAHLDMTYTVNLKVSGPEFRLIGLALAGKLKDNEDIMAANELNYKLLELRLKSLEDIVSTAKGAKVLAEKERPT